jgi:hypothetical protein
MGESLGEEKLTGAFRMSGCPRFDILERNCSSDAMPCLGCDAVEAVCSAVSQAAVYHVILLFYATGASTAQRNWSFNCPEELELL